MAVLVSELETRTNQDITATSRVLVVDPDDQQLFVIMAEEFRGSSVFYSALAPTPTPPAGADVASYKDGDVYYENATGGTMLYSYDETNSQWVQQGRVDGNRIWTDLTTATADSDDVLGLLNEDIFDNGDFYLNKSRGIMYGPYSEAAAIGFQLDSTDYSTFMHQRSNEVFIYTFNSAQDLNDPTAHIPSGDQNLNRRVWLPKDGDEIWLQKGNGNGHGGFRYTFSEATYTAGAGDHAANLREGWGFVDNGDGTTSNTSRRYHREESVLTAPAKPVFDVNSYREGDSVINTDDAVMYNGFVEFHPDGTDTTDLAVIFAGSESLKGSAILNITGEALQDDVEYNTGEFIITTEGSTTRMHGPYEFGAADDVSAWPLTSIIRQPFEHEISSTDHSNGLLMSTYTTDYPYYNGVMVAPGDTIRIVYSSAKSIVLDAGVEVDYGNKTLNWGSSTAHADGHQTHIVNNPARPTRNDGIYYPGDLFKTSVGDVYGPYVENQASDEDAWPFFYSLSPTAFIDITEDFSVNFQLPTANSSGAWGGTYLNAGDIVRVRFNGSTRNKHVLFEVVSVDGADVITWLRTTPDAGATIRSDDRTYPVRDDASYYAGDIWVSGSGIAYEYVEGQTDDASAWVVNYYARAPQLFVIETPIFNHITSTYPTAQASASGILMIPGDEIRYFIDSTGKSWFIKVGAVDHVAGTVTYEGSIYNSNPSLTHNLSTSGQPLLNDDLYSEGDFALTADRKMYGPYSHGQATNPESWPLYGDVTAPLEVTDTVTSDVYEFSVTNGELFLNLKP